MTPRPLDQSTVVITVHPAGRLELQVHARNETEDSVAYAVAKAMVLSVAETCSAVSGTPTVVTGLPEMEAE